MTSSATPVKLGNAYPDPKTTNFAKLLKWHFEFGTRPKGSPETRGDPWDKNELARAVNTDERNVRNWLAARALPVEIKSIERELFGKNSAYAAWRVDLRAASKRLEDTVTDELGIPRPPMEVLGRRTDITAILDVLLAAAPARAILVQGPPGIW